MTALRPDLALIAAHVAPGSRVLDVGCGDGALLAALRDERGCDARGMEIDPANVAECVGRGLSADRRMGYGAANLLLFCVVWPGAMYALWVVAWRQRSAIRAARAGRRP